MMTTDYLQTRPSTTLQWTYCRPVNMMHKHAGGYGGALGNPNVLELLTEH
jgi:hypothetical protein